METNRSGQTLYTSRPDLDAGMTRVRATVFTAAFGNIRLPSEVPAQRYRYTVWTAFRVLRESRVSRGMHSTFDIILLL